MREKRCYGCMLYKRNSPVCEHCGYDERTPNAPHQLPPGTVLNEQYIVGKVLGQGGFGITYIGWDEFLGIPVAIKEFYPSGVVIRDSARSTSVFLTSDSMRQRFITNRDRFVREATSLAKLGRSSNAANIVRVQNLVRANSTAYIIMEYVDGIDMRRYMHQKGGVLTLEETLHLLLPLVKSLQTVHENHIVHRDISPDNIMVMPDGSTKLIDFGAAHEVQQNADGSQKSTEAILKYGFAPPEQYQRKGELGPWTDVYALCATIYYCTTGKLPPSATDRLLGSEDFEWEIIPGISGGMIQALKNGTAIRKTERTQTMEQLRLELEKNPISRGSHPSQAHKDPIDDVPEVIDQMPAVFTPISAQESTAPVQEPVIAATAPLEESGTIVEQLAISVTVPVEEPDIPVTTLLKKSDIPVEEPVIPVTTPLKEAGKAMEEPEAAEPKAPVEEPGEAIEEPEIPESEASEEEPEEAIEEPVIPEPEAPVEEIEEAIEEPVIPEPEAPVEEIEEAIEEPVIPEPEAPVEEIEEAIEAPEIPEPEAPVEEPGEAIEEPEIPKPEAPVEESEESDTAAVQESSVPAPKAEAPAKPARKKHSVWPKVLAAVFAVVLLAGAAGILLFRSRPADGEKPILSFLPSDGWRKNVLMNPYDGQEAPFGYENMTVYRSDLTNAQILSVTFLDTLVEEPADSWDVSADKTGTVKAWAKPNGELYDLYIAAEDGINAKAACREMFSEFHNLQQVTFGKAFHTDEVQDMHGMFYQCENLTGLDLTNFRTDNVTDMAYMFSGCGSLGAVDVSGFHTANVKDMQFMFFNCGSLTTLDLSSFDTANVTAMQNMFAGCKWLTTLNLSCFNTANVKSMVSMFSGCYNLEALDLKGFDTGYVMNMDNLFSGCSSLTQLDLSSFNTANVTSMTNMFSDCDSLTALDLSSFDTGNVNSMSRMFFKCGSLTELDVTSFKTARVGKMIEMFYGCSSLKALDLSSFNTVKVSSMMSMFFGCSSLKELDVTSFDTSNLYHMYNMFYRTTALTEVSMPRFNADGIKRGEAVNFMDEGDSLNGRPWQESFVPLQYEEADASIAAPDTPVQTNAAWKENVLMHTYDSGETLSRYSDQTIYRSEIRNDQIRRVTFLDSLKKEPFDSWDVSAEQNGSVKAWVKARGELYDLYIAAEDGINAKDACRELFAGFANLQKVSFGDAFHTEQAQDMSRMFFRCGQLTELDVSHFDTANVTDMQNMFAECGSLTALELKHFDTKNVASMASMFAECGSLTTLNVASFNTANVKDMCMMFSGCGSLTELDVSRFQTQKAENMSYMFSGCSSLTVLDVSHFNPTRALFNDYMFADCSSLTQLDLRGFGDQHVSGDHMFAGCSTLTTLNAKYLTIRKAMFTGCKSLTTLNVSSYLGIWGNISEAFYGTDALTNLSIPNVWLRETHNSYAKNFMDEGDTINGQPWQSYFKPEQYS